MKHYRAPVRISSLDRNGSKQKVMIHIAVGHHIIITAPEAEEDQRIRILLSLKNERQLNGRCHCDDPTSPSLELDFSYGYEEIMKSICYANRLERLD